MSTSTELQPDECPTSRFVFVNSAEKVYKISKINLWHVILLFERLPSKLQLLLTTTEGEPKG